MDRIYENYSDTYVAARKIYIKGTDGFAYTDKECKTKATSDELSDAFIKGMIIVDGDTAIYKPISCKIASKVATVTYVTTDTTTATTAKLATVKSA